MKTTVVVGAQWGDEGKGKIVDVLADSADLVVRFQGGNNAGHTLVIDGQKTVLHHIPSGVLRGVHGVLSAGVVINPQVIWTEIKKLQEQGFLADPNLLTIGAECSVIMPYHQALDVAREESDTGTTIGTTGRGIGPCYEDRVARRSIFIRDLLNKETLSKKVVANLVETNALLHALGRPTFKPEDVVAYGLEYGEQLKPFIREAGPLVRLAKREQQGLLFEGAQGTMLDIGLGNYPFVTSSHTISASACISTGIPPQGIERVIGIAKAYCTRVGEGPFPTELHDADGKRLQDQGHEFGSTTGRPRRCGWLDLVALSFAIEINGITEIALMKLDVLSGFDTIALCDGYRISGGNEADSMTTSEFPSDPALLGRVTPVYRTFPGWSDDITGVDSFDQLPEAAQNFLKAIVEAVSVPISFVSVGPGRNQTFIWSHSS